MFFILLLITFNYSKAQPIFQMDTNYQDLGKINYSETLQITFTFKNSGNEPLIITRTVGDGGGFICTFYPREPIMPGKLGKLKFLYDTKRIGVFNKTGTITTNCSPVNYHIVKIKGEVIPIPLSSFRTRNLQFNYLFNGEIKSFEMSNNGIKPLIIKSIESVNHPFKLIPEKDTIQSGETIKLSFKLFSYSNNEKFNYNWKVHNNSPDSVIEINASGNLNFSPLIFYEDTLYKSSLSKTKYFYTECFNSSNDTIIVQRVSTSEVFENEYALLPGKEIFWSEGKEYIVPPFQKVKILVAYHTIRSTLTNQEFIFTSKNKKDNTLYYNYHLSHF
jgi:hypothetical protein